MGVAGTGARWGPLRDLTCGTLRVDRGGGGDAERWKRVTVQTTLPGVLTDQQGFPRSSEVTRDHEPMLRARVRVASCPCEGTRSPVREPGGRARCFSRKSRVKGCGGFRPHGGNDFPSLTNCVTRRSVMDRCITAPPPRASGTVLMRLSARPNRCRPHSRYINSLILGFCFLPNSTEKLIASY